MTYHPPIEDIQSALSSSAGLSDLIGRGLLPGVDEDLVASVLEEAGRFAAEEVAPLDAAGDGAGVTLRDGKVTVAPGWTETYRRWSEAGWGALSGPPEFGGQGLPHSVSMAVGELWNSACLSFGLCPLLTLGAIDAIHIAASESLKQTFLGKMIAGQWTGTMNLTEPQAGTDLGAIKTRAVPQADGSYRITGAKIFITYGDHEMTENIIHLVLARLPDAPPGTKGISLFLVPKFLVNPDGSLGPRNDVACTRLERKLGIHASPTCAMSFGAQGGATGYLVGEPNRGLNAMFIMMNRARLAVGVQGVAVSERATQKAIRYASERRQGRTETTPAGSMAPIAEHPDVRRNLLVMRALTQASRSLCLATARELDISERASDKAERSHAAARLALLTPIAKAFSTDTAVEVASIGIQVHGGMGFIEETGAAQHYRDARILPIYEGTNGVQALDLVTRKITQEGGQVVAGTIAELGQIAQEARASNAPGLSPIARRLDVANTALERATRYLLETLSSKPHDALAGATPYLRLFGLAAGGAHLAKAAMRAHGTGDASGLQRTQLARVFADQLSTAADGLATSVTEGGGAVSEADTALVRPA